MKESFCDDDEWTDKVWLRIDCVASSGDEQWDIAGRWTKSGIDVSSICLIINHTQCYFFKSVHEFLQYREIKNNANYVTSFHYINSLSPTSLFFTIRVLLKHFLFKTCSLKKTIHIQFAIRT